MQDKKCFPLFQWAANRQNPPQSSTARTPKLIMQSGAESSSNMPTPLKSTTEMQKRSKSANTEGKTMKSKGNSEQRTKFYDDEDASKRMASAHSAYKVKERLPNGKTASIRNCADFFGIASSTLSYRTSGKRSVTSPKKPGRPAVFTKEELQKIVNHLLLMADLGYGYSELQALNLIRYIASLKNDEAKKNFKASHGFMCYLMIQFPELSLRKALALEYTRASVLTIDTVRRFFQVLQEAYQTGCELSGVREVDPKDVWGMDEVGFSLCQGSNYKIIARKGSRKVNLITSADRQHITVVVATNARGFAVEPTFILKGTSQISTFFQHLKSAGFYNPLVLSGPKAYMDYECFNEWSKWFIKYAKFDPDSYSYLIYDGHVTHVMHLEALKLFLAKKILCYQYTVSFFSHLQRWRRCNILQVKASFL